jgi:hypothetical protein
MTNVLYLGPYRYNNSLGISSRAIIEELAQKQDLNVTTKNIFLENPYENSTLVNYNEFEREILPEYDVVIEHTTPSMMVVDRGISKKFVAIPIMDTVLSSYDIEKLNTFNSIYTDDYHNLNTLIANNLEAKIFSYNIKQPDKNNTVNIGYHNLNKKFYFIGDYTTNQNMINKIIVSFIMSFRSTNNVSLVLMLTDSNSQEVENQILSNIKDIYDKMDFHPILSPIKTISQPLSMEQLHTIHSFFDIHLDIRDSYNTGINRCLATTYNKPTIDIRALSTISVPSMDAKIGDINTFTQSVLTKSIVEAMSDVADLEKINIKPEDTISQLLCI